MPRKKRFYQPGVPVHVFQCGHNKEPVFFDDQDYLAYLRFLKAAADDLGCLIHAYVLMTNHVHLLACKYRIKSCHLQPTSYVSRVFEIDKKQGRIKTQIITDVGVTL